MFTKGITMNRVLKELKNRKLLPVEQFEAITLYSALKNQHLALFERTIKSLSQETTEEDFQALKDAVLNKKINPSGNLTAAPEGGGSVVVNRYNVKNIFVILKFKILIFASCCFIFLSLGSPC